MTTNLKEIYFDDSRLKMTVLGRAFVRFSAWVGYIILAVLTLLLLASFKSGNSGFWVGVLLLLFFTDLGWHANEGEESLEFLPKGGSYNTARALTRASFGAIESSLDRSLVGGRDFRYLLLSKLLSRPEIIETVTRIEVNPEELLTQAERELSKDQLNKKDQINLFLDHLAARAFLICLDNNSNFIEPTDLLSAIADIGDEKLNKIFSILSIEKSDLKIASVFSRRGKGVLRSIASRTETAGLYSYRMRSRPMNRAWTARPTPFLDRLSVDLTEQARGGRLGFLIGHDKEYDRLVDVLSRLEKPSALLVGDPGVGKDSILGHLAFSIIKDQVPEPLFDRRLIEIHIDRLTASVSGGELETRVAKVVDEIILAGNVILYIPDVDKLARISGSQYVSAADALLPVIKSGAFPVIGATYHREYKKYIEPHTEFASTFETINVEEISEEEATRVLTYLSLAYENKYHIIITFGAIKKAVDLAHKYFRQKLLPSSAEDLLREALSEASHLKEKSLNADLVVKVAEKKINIPMHQADRGEAERLLNLEEIIHRKLIDQDGAVHAVANALREYRSGLARKGGPIATFLFVGPTGVGKTELSKILAQTQFGSENMMVRFDMSEYQDKQSIFRFIGSPDGVITGSLTDAVMDKPYCLVLLDEFEKAHPDILNLFLQVFDDGRLTDNLGRVANFENTIIIATSNAHSDLVKQYIEEGKTMDVISGEIKKRLTDYFKPELMNRFTGVIVFRSLSREDIKKVAGLQLKSLAGDLADAKNVTLTFGAGVEDKIAELGYSEIYGARPLRNAISEKLRGPMAEDILRENIKKGDYIEVGLDNGRFIFSKKND